MCSSKHDLAVINSALSLGDRFLPPIGAVCRFRWPDNLGIYFEGRVMHHRYFLSGTMPIGVVCENLGDLGPRGELLVWVEEIIEVQQLPVGAPPFSEWPRL